MGPASTAQPTRHMQDTISSPPGGEAPDGPPVPEAIINALWRLLREVREIVTELRQNDRRQDALLNYKETARLLGVSERKVARYVADGEIPTINLDGAVRIHPRTLDAFVKRRARRGGR